MPFQFCAFQREDLARAALTDGCIIAWDPGLGKSIAAFTLPFLKLGWTTGHSGRPGLAGAALLVAPGGLHDQLVETGRDLFGQTVTRLDKAAFRRLARYDASTRRWALPPGFYLTSYTQLGRNGATPLPDWRKMCPRDRWASLGITPQAADARRRERHPTEPFAIPASEEEHWMEAMASELILSYTQGLDAEPNVAEPYKIRCVSETTLSDECTRSFDCVVVDEGTRLKGESFIAAGVLRLQPRFRYVLSATPIKNRVPDFFALAWWACGGQTRATPRFPYRPEDREDFAARFCQRMTKIDPKTGRRARGGWSRLTPQVCEIHALWKLNAAVVIRRRKQDAGVPIPPKHRHIIRVTMSDVEAVAYRKAMEADTDPGTKLARLRELSGLMSGKHLVAISLIQQIVHQGDQVIVFSSFNAPLLHMRSLLEDAGVPALLMTHETMERQRGAMAKRFAAGPVPGGVPVMLAGTACMSEGFNFPRCVHVIHMDYSLSADQMVQSDNRVHRLTSTREVHSWRILVDGTVDRALEALDGEKQDAAELVLDGELLTAPADEVTPAKVLADAARDMEAGGQFRSGQAIQADLRRLLASLRSTVQGWPCAPAGASAPVVAPSVDPEEEALAALLMMA